jgi:hypothetical protein
MRKLIEQARFCWEAIAFPAENMLIPCALSEERLYLWWDKAPLPSRKARQKGP